MKKNFYTLTAPAAKPCFSVKADAGDDTADIYLYDQIGGWGIGASSFVQALNSITASNINLRINSPGGDVFDGFAMYNALKEKNANITAHIDGWAASIASVIALGADEIIMAENAYFMIHNPWGVAIGDADEMRKQADVLQKLNVTFADLYADCTGQDPAVITDKMNAETWFNAQEAVDFGLADSIKGADGAKALFDISGFKNIPAALKRDIENSLRSAGMSRKDAKAALTNGFDPHALRDAGQGGQQRDAEMKELAELMSQGAGILSR